MTHSRVSDTILKQLGGAGRVHAMTGATITLGGYDLTLWFNGRLVGPPGAKLSHLHVRYDEVNDLYRVTASKLNRRTFQTSTIRQVDGIGAEQLKPLAEEITGLAFSL